MTANAQAIASRWYGSAVSYVALRSAVPKTPGMIWRLTILLLSFLIVGRASILTTKSAGQQRIGAFAKPGHWPRRSQVMLFVALFIGAFAASGLQDRYIGWAIPLFFISFWAAAYLPIWHHNRSLPRLHAGPPIRETPDDTLPAGR